MWWAVIAFVASEIIGSQCLDWGGAGGLAPTNKCFEDHCDFNGVYRADPTACVENGCLDPHCCAGAGAGCKEGYIHVNPREHRCTTANVGAYTTCCVHVNATRVATSTDDGEFNCPLDFHSCGRPQIYSEARLGRGGDSVQRRRCTRNNAFLASKLWRAPPRPYRSRFCK